MTVEAHDMTKHWRIISAEARNDDYRVYGTWWLAIKSRDVTAIDVTVWDQRASYGLTFGRELSFHDGEVAYRGGRDNNQAMVDDTRDLIAEVCQSVLGARLIGIEEQA